MSDHDDDLPDDDPLAGVTPVDETPEGGSPHPASDDPEIAARLPEAAALPLNDTGNGRRFALHFGQDVLFVPRVGWFLWDGLRWSKDPDNLAVRALAQRVADLIAAEVPLVTLEEWEMRLLGREDEIGEEVARIEAIATADRSDEDRKALARARDSLRLAAALRKRLGELRAQRRRHAKNAGNSGPITNMLQEAQVALARPLEVLDADPLQVNTESGVLQFSVVRGDGMSPVANVELVPHARDQLLSKLARAPWDPNARAPLFEAFLERIQPVREMREFLQRWCGYSMSGLTNEQKLAFWWGSGANGKSVLAEIINWLLGDYSATAKIESLTGRQRRGGGDATPDLVPLMGARSVRASEPDEGERLAEGIIKELTGGEPILVRALHSDFVEVRPIFKLTISGNHKPEVRGTDDGIWRRVLLVPFDVQIPPEERDPDLVRKLKAEAPGILNWMVQGLLDYLEGGLREPDQVIEATREYREDSDPVGSFLAAACVVTGSPEDSIPSKELVEAFNFWLDGRGEGQWRPKTISLRLREKAGRWKSELGASFTVRKSSVIHYDGIRLQDGFRRRLEAAPRDSQGRVLYTREES